MKKKPHFLWITDPWETLDHPRDTTLRLAQEAYRLGFKQSWANVRSIRYERNKVVIDSKPLISVPDSRESSDFKWGKLRTGSPCDFTSIQFRTDPPVDRAYLHPLQLLSLAVKDSKSTEVVNPLSVLLTLNEKMEAAALGSLMPPSLVSSQWEHLLQFGKMEGKTVLKPLDDAQSHGIELLEWKTPASRQKSKEILNRATAGFYAPVILQKYLKGISEGEIRLWFLDGKLLATVKKLPLSGDFRVNMDRGSQIIPYPLSSKEKKKASQISQHLKSRKIRLAAVDLIEDWVTDFNFTSPGLIFQMETLLNKNLARPIISALARPDFLSQ